MLRAKDEPGCLRCSLPLWMGLNQHEGQGQENACICIASLSWQLPNF